MNATSRANRGTGLAIALVAALVLSLGLVNLASAVHPPTKGPVPREAAVPGQAIDPNAVPDYVSVLGRDGTIVGYSPKDLILNPQVAPGFLGQPHSIPVYGDDLRTLVGQLVPDRGFVPVGAAVDSVPTVDASAAPGDGN